MDSTSFTNFTGNDKCILADTERSTGSNRTFYPMPNFNLDLRLPLSLSLPSTRETNEREPGIKVSL